MNISFATLVRFASRLLIAMAVMASLACGTSAQEEPTPFENRDEDVDEVIDRDPQDSGAAAEDEGVDIDVARDDVAEAIEVVRSMQKDADVRQLLEGAAGVFVIPDYASAALVIGAAGGEGVLFARDSQGWGNPGLYDVGSLSAGLQAGVATGAIALILLTAESVDVFKGDTNFALTADAGFTIVDWSARARTQIDEGSDVVIWTDTEGVFAELAIGFTNITWDEEENAEFYGQRVTARAVIEGEVANPHREMLQALLE